MRKRNKKKKGGGCALCKPGKHAKACRWKNKEKQSLQQFEKVKHQVVNKSYENQADTSN